MRFSIHLLVVAALAAGGARAQDADTFEGAKAACVTAIRAKLRDPDSMRLGEVKRGKTWMMPTTGGTVEARAYSVRVNARNGYGGYTGEQLYVCSLDLAERTVLGVEAFH